MNKKTQYKKKSKVPMIIFMGFVIITVAGMGKQLIYEDKTVENNDLADSIWEESYRQVEENRVGVAFDEITTTQEEYSILRNECNKWIENIDIKNEGNKVETETKITEEVYVDNLDDENQHDKNKQKNNEEVNTEMNEVGPIYLQDRLILRYIDNNGVLEIISAVKDENEYKLEELEKIGESFEFDKLGYGEKYNPEIDKLMPENTYLKNIGNTFLNIMNSKNVEELEKSKIEALRFFTKEGRETVLSGKSDINVIEKTTTKIEYIEAGKSDSNIFKNDRIYMRLLVDNGDEKLGFNVILKINSNGMIFDIDII